MSEFFFLVGSDLAGLFALLPTKKNGQIGSDQVRITKKNSTNMTVAGVQVLVNHYERCGRYYGSGGWGSHGSATEEEKRLTMMLFSGIFDSLAQRVRWLVFFRISNE